MGDNTVLPGTVADGDLMRSESLGGSPELKILGVKIHVGPDGMDNGSAQPGNDLPVVDSAPTFAGTGQINPVPTTNPAAQLPAHAIRVVTVKALNGNTGTVYLGNSSNVTPASGFELGAGESKSFFLINSNLIFVIASTANQGISWAAF